MVQISCHSFGCGAGGMGGVWRHDASGTSQFCLGPVKQWGNVAFLVAFLRFMCILVYIISVQILDSLGGLGDKLRFLKWMDGGDRE